jgi:hypothetical protein
MNVPEHAGVRWSWSCSPARAAATARPRTRTSRCRRTLGRDRPYLSGGIWDYLGWDDTFAKPEFTERQKRYNRALGYRGPYTPQVVYSGRVHGPGTKHQGYRGSLRKVATSRPIRSLSRSLTAARPFPAPCPPGRRARLASSSFASAPATKVTPGGGANKGKAMTYWNLVTKLRVAGRVEGRVQSVMLAPALPAASCWCRRMAPKAHGHWRGAEEVVATRRSRRAASRYPPQSSSLSAKAQGGFRVDIRSHLWDRFWCRRPRPSPR